MAGDIVTSIPNLLANQLPFATLLVIIGIAGAKKVWVFGHVLEDREKSYRERITEVRSDAATSLASLAAGWEARLKEKDEECERERVRGDRLEAYTDRLIDAAMEATVLATRATTRKDGG